MNSVKNNEAKSKKIKIDSKFIVRAMCIVLVVLMIVPLFVNAIISGM